MRAIFISYRREDTEGQAGRLFDDLVKLFGEQSVFMDVAAIEPGRDFRKAIDEHVASCGVLLALMGKNWVDARDQAGNRRLDDPLDFVRLETAAALKRDIPVVPVLVHGASMPRADQLPADLADLAFRNAIELTHARWNSDLTVLGKALSRYITPSQPDTTDRGSIERGTQNFAPQSQIQRRLVMAIVTATILVLGAGGVYFLKPPTPVPAPSPVQSSPRVESPPRIEAPAIAFSANPPSIKAGESTELRWSTTNADNVTIPNVVDGANPSGNRRVSPSDTTTFTVIAHGKGGEKTETATVQVEKPNPPAPAPVVEYFRTEPQQVQPGEATELLWSVKNADRVVLRIPTERGERRVEPVGRMQVRPESTSAYMLVAEGTGGEKTAEATVRVERPTPPTAQLPRPDVVGEMGSEAVKMMAEAGYDRTALKAIPGTPHGQRPGTVLSVDYSKSPGLVTLTLDPGVKVPQLKGLSMDAAERDLRGAGLVVSPPRYASELDKDDGIVIASDPDGDAQVASNSSVTLTINRKPAARPNASPPPAPLSATSTTIDWFTGTWTRMKNTQCGFQLQIERLDGERARVRTHCVDPPDPRQDKWTIFHFSNGALIGSLFSDQDSLEGEKCVQSNEQHDCLHQITSARTEYRYVRAQPAAQPNVPQSSAPATQPTTTPGDGIVDTWDEPNTSDAVRYIIRRIPDGTYTIQGLRSSGSSSLDLGTGKLNITQGNVSSLVGVEASAVLRRSGTVYFGPNQPGREDVVYLWLEWKTSPNEAIMKRRFESYRDGKLSQQPIERQSSLVRHGAP